MAPHATQVSAETLAYQGTGLEAFDELALNQTHLGLLHQAHSMWCGDSCRKDIDCTFLHFIDPFHWAEPPNPDEPIPSPLRHPYNKDTAHLLTLMNGKGYQSGISQKHEINFWPLVEAAIRKIDGIREHSNLLYCDYTDWTKKHDPNPALTIQCTARDTLQWLGMWVGGAFDSSLAGVRIVSFTVIPDEICIPPLDLIHQRFRMYGRSFRDLIEEITEEGWGQDATRILLSTLRQYFFQYLEKVEFEDNARGGTGIHALMGRREGVWDSIVYRTHTAGTYPCVVVCCRILGLDTLKEDWLLASSINNAISMDLSKSTLRVYKQDNFQPTASYSKDASQKELEVRRATGYHSVYLDLLDDMVNTGCPTGVTHFASSGFLYVPVHHRYLERSMGFRFLPIHKTMMDEIGRIFGDNPSDAWLDGIYRLRLLTAADKAKRPAGFESTLCPDLLAACEKRQEKRKSDMNLNSRTTNDWVAAVHGLAKEANTPDELQNLLVPSRLSADQLRGIGSLDDIWALCAACKADCSDDCEWLAFAKYTWKHVCTNHVAA
ncbi:uncharacterized protein F4822DRAFT_394345 [Hypoxylon trugodes]|uniref:uncharacterized protein n=1 Tax=Hypoxylon trugodes TaxID=326681 RepID=UPI00219677D2|nr:uncharacterized protein F4822DRAFT_394345 [Hypoxylon trugodes]KAI1390749.1 hypothetical protein F4822DRAFT_394345 [Hypoxylon trugodes]